MNLANHIRKRLAAIFQWGRQTGDALPEDTGHEEDGMIPISQDEYDRGRSWLFRSMPELAAQARRFFKKPLKPSKVDSDYHDFLANITTSSLTSIVIRGKDHAEPAIHIYYREDSGEESIISFYSRGNDSDEDLEHRAFVCASLLLAQGLINERTVIADYITEKTLEFRLFNTMVHVDKSVFNDHLSEDGWAVQQRRSGDEILVQLAIHETMEELESVLALHDLKESSEEMEAQVTDPEVSAAITPLICDLLALGVVAHPRRGIPEHNGIDTIGPVMGHC